MHATRELQIFWVWRFTQGRAKTIGGALSFVWKFAFYISVHAKLLGEKMFIVIYSRAFLQSYFIIIEIEELIFFEAKSQHTT